MKGDDPKRAKDHHARPPRGDRAVGTHRTRPVPRGLGTRSGSIRVKTIQRAARPRGPAYSLEFPGKSVAVVRMDVPKARDWEQWFLIRADVHHDNPHSDRAREEAPRTGKERGAGVLSIGDTFCAMQGKYDKRSDKSCLRPEHQHGDYLDRLVTTAADFYEPYAHHLILFGEGNHESAIRKRHETDLLERLAQTLRDRTGAKGARAGTRAGCDSCSPCEGGAAP